VATAAGMSGGIAVVGGGVTGLALAGFLQDRGADVTVVEAAAEPGGLSVAARYPEFTWDRYYHVITPADRALLEWLDALGLGHAVRWTPTCQAVWLAGRVHPLNRPLDLLRLPGLSLFDKLRLGLLVRSGRRPLADHELDTVTSADFLRARCGARAYDRLWRHLLRSKLGDAAERASARFIHATLRRLASARRVTGTGERFGYVDGGYRAVLDAAVAMLRQRGATILAGSPVRSVRHEPATDRVVVTTDAAEHRFARAVLTLPNQALAAIAADLAPAQRVRLAATTYLGVACTVAIGAAPLSGNYILNLCDDDLSLTGIIEMTSVVDRERHTNGRTLVYLPRYAVADSPLFDAPDAAIAERALADLARVFPATRTGWLLHRAVHRTRQIQPVPIQGAPPVAPPRTVVERRVFCVNNAQLPACVLNNNDCVQLARDAAAGLLA
jgi:protoporphyrinogen oxidase